MHPRVIEEETGLPIGFDSATGEMVRFEEVAASPERLARLKPMDDDEQKTLAVARIEGFEGWPTRVILPGGVVDRERALRELREGSDLVEVLVGTEMRVVDIVRGLIREEAGHG